MTRPASRRVVPAAVQWLLNAWRGRDRAEAVRQAYRRVFSTPDGRLVLADLARYCNVASTSFTPGDPHATAFNEGHRDVFNHVAGLLRLDPVAIDRALRGDPDVQQAED